MSLNKKFSSPLSSDSEEDIVFQEKQSNLSECAFTSPPLPEAVHSEASSTNIFPRLDDSAPLKEPVFTQEDFASLLPKQSVSQSCEAFNPTTSLSNDLPCKVATQVSSHKLTNKDSARAIFDLARLPRDTSMVNCGLQLKHAAQFYESFRALTMIQHNLVKLEEIRVEDQIECNIALAERNQALAESSGMKEQLAQARAKNKLLKKQNSESVIALGEIRRELCSLSKEYESLQAQVKDLQAALQGTEAEKKRALDAQKVDFQAQINATDEEWNKTVQKIKAKIKQQQVSAHASHAASIDLVP